MNTEITGNEFNKIYKDIKLYKFLYNDLVHFNFKYELGLNIDTIPFNPTNECSKGGLYFCEESKCHLFWRSCETKLATVIIPDNARIYVEHDKFKADRLIITEILNFEDVSDDFWIRILSKSGLALRYVKNQTNEICELAVQQNGLALKYVRESLLTKEICDQAVENNILARLIVKTEYNDEMLCKKCGKYEKFEYCENCKKQEYCENCKYCENCEICEYCEICEKCGNCGNCENCANCENCKYYGNYKYCGYCENCEYCEYCGNCVNCVNCGICEYCE